MRNKQRLSANLLSMFGFLLLLPAAAQAYPGGVSGYSGRAGSCANCHAGGTAPSVSISGPTSLQPGASGTFMLTIRGGAAVEGGLDVSLAGGGSLGAGSGSKIMNGEVTQSSSGRFSGGALSYQFTVTAPSSAGNLSLSGAGLSSNGNVDGSGTGTASHIITVSAPPPPPPPPPPPVNAPPTVSLTSPSNGATVVSPGNVTISAAAADSDGSVAKVEFFANGVKLGESANSPYQFVWMSPSVGSHSITARATDNGGAMTSSSPVSVNVTSPTPGNVPPVVSLTSPTAGNSFTGPATISVAASASDSDGTVSKVEFYAAGMKIGEAMAAPYTFSWTNVAAGSYAVTAKATDNQGASTVSTAASITVTGKTPPPTNAPPKVAITSPHSGAALDGSKQITLTASASDSDGTVVKVTFFSDGAALGSDITSPYVLTTHLKPGAHRLTARAFDNQGAMTESASVDVQVKSAGTGSCGGDEGECQSQDDLSGKSKITGAGAMGCSAAQGTPLSIACLFLLAGMMVSLNRKKRGAS